MIEEGLKTHNIISLLPKVHNQWTIILSDLILGNLNLINYLELEARKTKSSKI